MNTDSATAHKSWWADTPGGKKQSGMRIDRKGFFVWIPDNELLTVANAIADYLTENGNNK